MSHDRKVDLQTLVVHAGEQRPAPEGSIVFPIYQSTVYAAEAGTPYDDLRYARLNNTPSQRRLHETLAPLEGAEAALATSSGMAALTTALMSVLRPGDHVLAANCLYGGTHDFLTRRFESLGWSYTFVDTQQPDTWEAARRPETRLFLLETISNPLMRVPRLDAVVDFARQHAVVTLIDNTFASPINFRPLAMGFDLVFHSATKYLNGHSDLVAGCLFGSRDRIEAARRGLNLFGGCLDPHAAFLLARGIKTLALRVRAHNEGALALARALAEHPKIALVNYPGLPGHPDHDHASEFLDGFGGMLSFRPNGGVPAADSLLQALTLPWLAPSLGGVETLVTRPVWTSHAGMSAEERAKAGVDDDLIRVSVGVESPRDIVADFLQALEQA